ATPTRTSTRAPAWSRWASPGRPPSPPPWSASRAGCAGCSTTSARARSARRRSKPGSFFPSAHRAEGRKPPPASVHLVLRRPGGRRRAAARARGAGRRPVGAVLVVPALEGADRVQLLHHQPVAGEPRLGAALDHLIHLTHALDAL